MEECYALLAQAGSQHALLERMQSRRELYDLIRYEDYEALDATIAKSTLPQG
jgi:methylisocitrate lyase